MNNSVPTGWSLQPLSALAHYYNGRAFKPEDWSSEGLPIIRIAQINNKNTDLDYYAGDDVSDKNRIINGDLLFSWSATLTALIWNRGDAVLNQHIFKVEEKAGVDRKYLHQVILNSIEPLADYSHGSTMKHIKKGVLDEYCVGTPPLHEQQKIATILSSVDDVIEKTRAQIDKLKDLKTGMMQELLIKGIGHTEFKDSPVGLIPIGWDISNVRSLCSVVTKGTTPTSLGHDYKESGINFIKVESIIRNGVIDPNKFSYIDEAANKALTRSILCAGDILITIAGATVGKLAMVNESHIPANTNQALSIVRVNPSKVNRLFLYYWLQSGHIVNQVWSIQTVGAQPNLSLVQVGDFSVPLPSIEEQNQITYQLIALDRKKSLSSTKLDMLLNLKKALMQDLLTGKVRVKLTDKESAAS